MAVSIRILQRVDRALGPIVCTLFQPLRLVRRRTPEHVSRVLVVKFWGLGSITLLGPAVRVLRRRFPDARIDLLTLEATAAYARRLGGFDEVIPLAMGETAWSITRGIARMLLEVRKRRYDRLYDFEFLTYFSAIVARLSRAPWTAGYAAPEVWRGDFFDEVVPFNRYWHVARNARSLAGGENGEEVRPEDQFRPMPTDAGRADAERALADGPVAPDRPIVVVNPNAGQLALERRWPADNVVSLLNGLLGHTRASVRVGIAPGDVRVILIGARDEREYTEGIRLRCVDPDRVDDLAGALSIDGLLAVLERAAVVVTNDSGPLHLAGALGRPVIAMYGPETPVMYAPLAPAATVLYRPPACSPCINVHENKLASCHYGHPLCLERISPEEVLVATVSALRRGGHRLTSPAAGPL
ncbi:MAG TPA: glycosyltransferase family 9 protein [Planctomycetota bacterium]|nr:glycosyltransferase family 9 protein [Planctomycetota bacterium]